MKKVIFLFGFVGLFIFSLGMVNANGCCFDHSSGLCSMNTPLISCNSGNWFGDHLCGGVSECNLGCCIIGTTTKYLTQRTCQLESQSAGFETKWQQGISQQQCSAMSGTSEFGACVYSDRYENNCQFVSLDKCGGTFYSRALCSDSSLNTKCIKTDKTKCFEDEGIYHLDSCGNRDVLVQKCDYNSGTICIQKNSKEAHCKSLNCQDKWGNTRNNGESWCIGADGEIMIEDWREVSFKKVDGKTNNGSFASWVGARFFKQVCIDGKVITEPCADYRNEVCVPGNGEAKCIANPANDCLLANRLDEATGLNKVEECDERYCFLPRLEDCVVNDAGQYLCGEERLARGSNPNFSENVAEAYSPFLKDLNLEMCVPKISTGNTLSSNTYSSEQGVCNLGDYLANVVLDHDKGSSNQYLVKGMNEYKTVVDIINKKFGNAGIISLDINHWHIYDWINDRFSFYDKLKNPLAIINSSKATMSLGTWWEKDPNWEINMDKARRVTPDPIFIMKLNQRTAVLGDCAGSLNWIKASTGKLNNTDTIAVKDHGSEGIMVFQFSYLSKPWIAPNSGDCSKCGLDDLPCSEYRCKAIAKNCEYKEPKGIDSGICISSSDSNPPSITHIQNPINKIPPYSPVLITLYTNEDSYCRFDFSSVGGQMNSMKYETSGKFGKEHQFYLSIPGKAVNEEDIKEYPILTRDGEYRLFIRCEDGVGNYNINPYIINLIVEDNPDGIPPSILQFIPQSNSFIKANTSFKEIKFKINEPAECRWSFSNQDYDSMGQMLQRYESTEFEDGEEYNSNQFLCDNSPSERGTIDGYWCFGNLTNVTNTIGQSTKYYIRCKDQPLLEGKETEIYKRNTNAQSFEYILRPSLPLEISEVYPNEGDFIIGGTIGNLTYTVKTIGGAENGKAQCSWRLNIDGNNTSWHLFTKTNSSNHETLLTTLRTEQYLITVLCEDSAGNKANKSSELNILIDNSPPIITRIYNNRGEMTLILDEPAICKSSTKGDCYTLNINGTLMNSINRRTEFTTKLVKGTRYFIRCQDDFGNSRCFDNIVFH
jgi:hypothetical protein